MEKEKTRDMIKGRRKQLKAIIKRLMKRALERVGGSAPVSDQLPLDYQTGSYYIRSDYRARDKAIYFHDFEPREEPRVYQPDIYSLADVLSTFGARRIIDVGCGKALKLSKLAERHEIIGLDYGENIEYCRAQYSVGQYVEHDIESDRDLPLEGVPLARAVVVCADVIEHLHNPLRLLRKLKACVDKGAVVIFSTPERELVYGSHHIGPPRNTAHVREWKTAELRALLLDMGFSIAMMGLTANDSIRREFSTIFAVLTAGDATAD